MWRLVVMVGCGVAFIEQPYTRSETVRVTPKDNVAALVTAAPPGTSFLFAPGLYLTQINPKDGDSFTGQGKVVLTGAQPLAFTAAGGVWTAAIGANPRGSARCAAGHPLCDQRRDLYVDDVPLAPVNTAGELSAKGWYFDAVSGTATLNFDPAGHNVEISTLKWAFANTGADVSLSHLIVEKYASPPQFGAVGAQGAANPAGDGARGWHVSDTEVRLSHGTGIQLSDGSSMVRCFVHHNGQKGVGARGPHILLQDSEISWNNFAGYDYGWEAGGSKFSRTTDLQVLNNSVHDNAGGGLWADIDNQNALFRLNKVEHNAGTGIQYEISYGALIEQNTVRENGSAPRVSLWQAQISIQNSSGVTVRENTVVVPKDSGNGIVVINQERGIGDLGARLGVGNTVTGNTVTYLGTGGASGLMDPLGTATNNRFDTNTYIFQIGGEHFESRGKKTWEQYRALGNDPSSRILDLTKGGAAK